MLSVLDIFSGVGGLSYGFANIKYFDIKYAIEYDADIAKTYQLNHPQVKMRNDDIRNITNEELKAMGNIDIVIGGPPCQSYSTSGKRELDDRAYLFRHYKRVIKALKPKLFIFENVVGILSMDNGKLFDTILQEFKSIGYNVKYQVLNAADYGVPQIRKRVIIVGTLDKNTFEYPKATHNESNYVTFRDATCDLPVLRAGQSADTYVCAPINNFQSFVRDTKAKKVSLHKAPKANDLLQQRMNYLQQGQSNKDLPDELKANAFPNSYGKLWENKPSTTITTNFSCPSSARCIHPTQNRALTIREGARLQSFPDSFKFYGSNEKIHIEIGNAVPPLLSIALTKQVVKCFKER